MSAGQNGDGLSGLTVVGQGTMGMSVGAQDIGQHPGVRCVGLGSGDAASIAIAGCGQWVDRVDLAAGGPQSGDEEPARRLDGDRNRGAFALSED